MHAGQALEPTASQRETADAIVVDRLTKIYQRDVPLRRWLAWGMGIGSAATERNGEGTGAVHALEDVSFSVRKGEAFGVIGRNGAGKSTLLQILAGTLTATAGECRVEGRITALLELGSGFNPEFTGRENIYLAGSILGIGRDEMDRKLPEIESFAEIGAFIEQPVRTYSTGMLMRVAFSVAVAVDPDILIIDEALSVGDILFQQKCNRRMRELLEKGATMLAVTHDTAFVLNICHRALWLDRGRTAYLGEASSCVRRYLAAMGAAAGNQVNLTSASENLPTGTLPAEKPLEIGGCRRLGDGGIAIDRLWMMNEAGENTTVYRIGEWCRLVVVIRAHRKVRLASGGCELRDRHGQVIFATGLRVVRRLIDEIAEGESCAVSMRFKVDLGPGQYTVDVGCGAGEQEDNTWQRVVAAAVMEVTTTPGQDVVHGLVRLPYEVQAFRPMRK
jgi:lipopolysaccharide transport system ATP-binding protein